MDLNLDFVFSGRHMKEPHPWLLALLMYEHLSVILGFCVHRVVSYRQFAKGASWLKPAWIGEKEVVLKVASVPSLLQLPIKFE